MERGFASLRRGTGNMERGFASLRQRATPESEDSAIHPRSQTSPAPPKFSGVNTTPLPAQKNHRSRRSRDDNPFYAPIT